jgi:hypothetical protein
MSLCRCRCWSGRGGLALAPLDMAGLVTGREVGSPLLSLRRLLICFDIRHLYWTLHSRWAFRFYKIHATCVYVTCRAIHTMLYYRVRSVFFD